MKIIIAGGSGFIGKPLVNLFSETQNQVIVLSRNPLIAQKLFNNQVKCLKWDGLNISHWQSEMEGTNLVINLMGENIGQGRWSKSRKTRILESRLIAGQAMVKAFIECKKKPGVLIQSSASGYYGNENSVELDEQSPAGKGFLADVCREWEKSSAEVEMLGVRRVVIRTGLVLAKEGGMLKKMLYPFQLGLGGPLGAGNQILPWIHMLDQLRAIQFLASTADLQGVFNLTAPNPVSMNTFSKTLGEVLKRPAFLKVPVAVLKLLLGEMAQETVLSGQYAVPRALLKAGFKFQYPELKPALHNLLN